eukprot:CAMPEP_0118984778 /NCGR_PEP_ID=MMETSP1173-20130426/38490_1 /TAXON_ID=1034831 /ORGANISM="Rhizochromulina marina cf, Strain CCMP1243" /LENGTH=102 /DNA_ID=CAMNT_0006935455 /DNA_START=54 /DNA_END=358 /DNA_ORIENTATION=+
MTPVKDIRLTIGGTETGPRGGTDLLLVAQRADGKVWPDDVAFMDEVAVLTRRAVRCVRGREQRTLAREQRLAAAMETCAACTGTNFAPLFNDVLEIVARCLP